MHTRAPEHGFTNFSFYLMICLLNFMFITSQKWLICEVLCNNGLFINLSKEPLKPTKYKQICILNIFS